MRSISYFFFYTYVGLVCLAGLWGAFGLARTDFSLLMQADLARFNYESALRQYKNEKNSLDLAKMILDRTSIKYKEGMASSFDLTQAQNQFLDSSANYTRSIIEMLSAKIALNKILNNL